MSEHTRGSIARSPSTPRSAPPPDKGHPLRDRTIRFLGVPFFGLIIPRVSGCFGTIGPDQAAYWLGTLWFVFLSFVVWQGNRALHYWLRQRIDRLQYPALKFASLLAANVFFTIPVSTVLFVAWYVFSPWEGIEWASLTRGVALTSAAVLFVSHAYETMFLLHERRADRVSMALAERARWQAELDTLKGQLAPHFLFNCLNTLSVLIAEEPRTARKFNLHLANLCRYLLTHKEHDLVPLAEELAFFSEYVELAQIRHRDALQVAYQGFDDTDGLRLPPASLQILLENAIKHNTCSPEHPLHVEVALHGDALTVSNPIRTPAAPPDSMGTGLNNLRDRFELVVQRQIGVSRDAGVFRVTLPLVRDC